MVVLCSLPWVDIVVGLEEFKVVGVDMEDAVDRWRAFGNLAFAVCSGGEVVDKSYAGFLCAVGYRGVLRQMSLVLD